MKEASHLPLGIIFDFDGTLIDSESRHELLYREAVRELGYDLTAEVYHAEFRGKTDQEIFDIIGRSVSEPNRVEERMRWKMERFEQLLLEGKVPSMPGAVPFIRAADARGLLLALGTSAVYREAELGLKGLEVFDLFKGIVSAESVTQGKPAPEVYLKAADLLQLNPVDCLVYEDSVQGVTAAHAAGIPVIAVSTFEANPFIKAGAMTVIPDFRNHEIPAVRV